MKFAQTRDEAREIFKQSGLTYEDLTQEKVNQLRDMINDEMEKSGFMKETFRCTKATFNFDDPRKRHAAIRCCSFYFSNREAVSFNRDGFIGFAGWADATNVVPILTGFSKWLKKEAPCQKDTQ